MKIIILTWKSWSWKTTIQNALIKEGGWNKPINFTTRKKRNDEELDEYVFCTKKQFVKKLLNWDFIEHTIYWWQMYWLTKSWFWQKNIIITDPIWRAQLMKEFWTASLIFLEISEEEQFKRLKKRGSSNEEIEKRMLDWKWFEPTRKSIIINGNTNIKTIVSIINNL